MGTEIICEATLLKEEFNLLQKEKSKQEIDEKDTTEKKKKKKKKKSKKKSKNILDEEIPISKEASNNEEEESDMNLKGSQNIPPSLEVKSSQIADNNSIYAVQGDISSQTHTIPQIQYAYPQQPYYYGYPQQGQPYPGYPGYYHQPQIAQTGYGGYIPAQGYGYTVTSSAHGLYGYQHPGYYSHQQPRAPKTFQSLPSTRDHEETKDIRKTGSNMPLCDKEDNEKLDSAFFKQVPSESQDNNGKAPQDSTEHNFLEGFGLVRTVKQKISSELPTKKNNSEISKPMASAMPATKKVQKAPDIKSWFKPGKIGSPKKQGSSNLLEVVHAKTKPQSKVIKQ